MIRNLSIEQHYNRRKNALEATTLGIEAIKSLSPTVAESSGNRTSPQ